MLCALICIDKPDGLDTRKANRDAHVAYLKESPVVFAGPFLADDGETMNGSLIVLDLPGLDAARKWAENDPYAKAGLFDKTEIREWKKVIG